MQKRLLHPIRKNRILLDRVDTRLATLATLWVTSLPRELTTIAAGGEGSHEDEIFVDIQILTVAMVAHADSVVTCGVSSTASDTLVPLGPSKANISSVNQQI